MRRSIPVIVATAGGLALLANFHTASGHGSLAPVASGGTTTLPLPPPTSTSPSTIGETAPPTGATPTTTTPATRIAPTTSTAPASAGTTQVLDGPVVTTDYGPVQVRVTMQGSRILDVQALELPSDRSRSVRISQEAGPILRSEALQAQSANIDIVSGASFTSDGYARSLQAALDRAPA